MSQHDHRTKSDDQVSFYVFDDLRFQQNKRGRFILYRYDTIEEAIAKYRDIPAEMTPALGMHRSAMSELDLAHRREGEHVLVTDYLNFSPWRTDDNVQQAVSTACDQLNIQWHMNSRLISTTILLPLERGIDRLPDKVFDDKSLFPRKPRFYAEKPSPLSAINEAYVEGEGWMDFQEFFKKAESFGYDNPHCMKASKFNINYIDSRGHTGQADISPLDLQIMRERYTFQYGEPTEIKAAAEKLAEEIAEFTLPRDAGSLYLDSLKESLSRGDVAPIVRQLQAIRDHKNSTEHDIAVSTRLLSRLQSLVSEQKPALDMQLNIAARKASNQQKSVSPNGREGMMR